MFYEIYVYTYILYLYICENVYKHKNMFIYIKVYNFANKDAISNVD